MFRLLKLRPPPNGWGAVGWELAIVTLGVLIALGFDQMVKGINERSDVDEIRRALVAELADDRARWEFMRAADPCTIRRLDAIDQWLATAPTGEKVPDAFSPMLWNMHSTAWDIAKTSPVAGRIPLDERLTFASLYGAIDNWRDYLTEERANAVELRALLATADQAENRRQVAEHVDVARNAVERRRRNYAYFFTRMDALRVEPDPSRMTITTDYKAMCEPLKPRG
jgi:hypothetical protein